MKKFSFLDKVEDMMFVRAIRRGLIMTIPLLMIGSFALVLNIMPLPPYQAFLQTPVGAQLSRFFNIVNQVTFGILSLASTICVSAAYARIRHNQTAIVMGASLASMCTYAIFIGIFTEDFSTASLGAQGMFTALFSAIMSSKLYCWLVERDWFSFRLYTIGADIDFNNVVSVIMPAALVVFVGYVINQLIAGFFNVSDFEALFHKAMFGLFNSISNNSLRALLFVVLTNLMWFFGIHGTNVLDAVAKGIFYGEAATAAFLNKSVLDTFVWMGGCGTTIGLLVAILLFSKKKNTRSLAKMASLPMWFNINELMVFGLPIVFNPTFFIPFLAVPLVCVGTTAVALTLGIVPPPTNQVEWVVPLFINGYQATGSIAGSLLQVFNIGVSAFIYRFFVLRYEKRTNERIMHNMDELVGMLKKNESTGEPLVLLEMRGGVGGLTKMLAADLQHVLKQPDSMVLYYQPQYDEKNRCVGAEALLRWNHPLCGMVYPPLVIGLAVETGLLAQMEHMIFRLASQDIRRMKEAGVCPHQVSVNATASSLQDPEFVVFLEELLAEYPEIRGTLCIELTEQMSFMLGEAVENRLREIHAMGFSFSVDDFSMGHTSVKYLQINLFDEVKLDGSLVRDMMENERSVEIISSIVHMAKTMNFTVLAEFVETVGQRNKLMELGCYRYQGWLYSPAIPLDDFINRFQREKEGASPFREKK